MLSKALSGTLALLFTLAIATIPNDTMAQSDSKRSSSTAFKVKNSRASSEKKRDKSEKRSGRSKGQSGKNKGKRPEVPTVSSKTVLVTNGPATPNPAIVIPSVAPFAPSPLASATATFEFIGNAETPTSYQTEEYIGFISSDAPPMATFTPRPLSEEEQCALQVVNERLVRCCDGGSEGNSYGPYYNCTDFAFDFHGWCEDEAHHCKTVTLECENRPIKHSANLIRLGPGLGTSWGLVDPNSGEVVGTFEKTAGTLACKAMGVPERDCDCDREQGCKCRITGASDDPILPNTDPAGCSNKPSLDGCLSCCEELRARRTGIGVEVCKNRMPGTDKSDYVGWILMCAKYAEELQSWLKLCEHACKTNLSE